MMVASFISNFKKYKDLLLFIVSIVVVTTFIFLCNKGMTYLIVSDKDSYTRVMLYEMYNQEENIDILFLGSSHCYRSLDTDITDNIFGMNTFNAGTSSQDWDGSYALLVEAGKENDIKHVFVEMYYNSAGVIYDERTQLKQTYIISDYMKNSYNRYRYLFQASNIEHWLNGLVPARRNWRDLFSPSYILNNLSIKQSDEYINYAYPTSDVEYYSGKGYVSSLESKSDNFFFSNGDFKKIPNNIFSEDDKKSLKNIIKYCDDNKIKLTFFSAPMTDYLLVGTDNYDFYIEQVNDFVKEYGVKYYDFNICREKYFPTYDGSYFKDGHHLNGKGAERFSNIFSDFFTGKVTYEEMFYMNWREKIKDTDRKQTYGVICKFEEKEVKKVILEPVQYNKQDVYYTIYKKAYTEEEWQEIGYLTKDNTFSLPKNEKGELRISTYTDPQGKQKVNELFMGY